MVTSEADMKQFSEMLNRHVTALLNCDVTMHLCTVS